MTITDFVLSQILTQGQPKHYCYGLVFFKHWFWFADPEEVPGASMVNCFSYHRIDKAGWCRKDGLTTVIDLNQDLDTIWSKMRQKFIREQIQKGVRHGIIVRQDDNFAGCKKIYTGFRKSRGLHRDRFALFKKHGLLFSAYQQDRLLACGIFVSNQRVMRALVLCSRRLDKDAGGQERDLVGQANRLLIWEAIKQAKASGHKLFDLGGISPDDKDSGQRTLSEFKEAFGGERLACYYYFKVYSLLLRFWLHLRGFENV